MKIRYYCHFAHLTGYSRAAHDYLMALVRAGSELDIRPVGGGPGGALEPRYAALERFVQPVTAPEPPVDAVVYHLQPWQLATVVEAGALAKAPVVAAITTWETLPMPELFAASLRQFDRVIVPSAFCYSAVHSVLSAHPIGDVLIVPHTFDPEFWTPVKRSPRSPYRFYTIGAWSARKNHEGLLRAYLHAFTREDDVELLIIASEADTEAAHRILLTSGLPRDQWPRLTIPKIGALSERDLFELHADGDCFVSATRGEGWGLGAFEAAIMGNAVVIPGGSGSEDFATEDFRQCGGAAAPVFGTIATNATHVSLVRGMDCKQAWAEPDLRELGWHMRAAAESGERNFDTATLAERFSYDVVGPQLLRALTA